LVSSYAVAVDIGGTFTDAVLRRDDGTTWADKSLTTYGDLLDGFFSATDAVLAQAGIGPKDVDDVVVHATTIVTNSIIERRGPPCALLVTRGFRDVLYIREEHRYDMFDPQIEYAEPYVSRDFTFGVDERTLADGTVETEVDPAKIAELAAELRDKGVVSVAVSLLNAYLQPANERAIRDVLAEVAPDLYVTLSSDVAPQIREYPRTATAVLNAYVRPIAEPYLRRLGEQLAERGFPSAPLIMLSNGGVLGAETAGRFPVRMIESGPAAGALVASYYADLMGLDRLLSFDMGGTGIFEVDRMYRFKAGSGTPVIVPSIDMIEIGAGGGSIAHVDGLGLLKVGPRSAGSEPGPACYGRGGDGATVTDADLVLGLLDADNFLGGDMALDRGAAERTVGAIAAKLGAATGEPARGIYRVVGEAMAAAARAHATDRGIDYRGLPVLAFGGAGPVHACLVAELLESTTVIFPPLASVLSAFGTLVTPPRIDLARGWVGPVDWERVRTIVDEMVAEGSDALIAAGAPPGGITLVHGADMRYLGQANEVTVTLPGDPAETRDLSVVRESFEKAYEAQYGLRLPDVEIEVVAWRLSAQGPDAKRDSVVKLPTAEGKPKGTRPVRFGAEPEAVAVYDRASLAGGQTVAGPAIIEERETTIVLLPGWDATVDARGSIIANRGT
jgi:N-methylhydantoinase A